MACPWPQTMPRLPESFRSIKQHPFIWKQSQLRQIRSQIIHLLRLDLSNQSPPINISAPFLNQPNLEPTVCAPRPSDIALVCAVRPRPQSPLDIAPPFVLRSKSKPTRFNSYIAMPDAVSGQWQSEGAQLPPFYSPRTESSNAQQNDGDIEPADLTVQDRDIPASPTNDAKGIISKFPVTPLSQPPPSSLLSPAFTPPATPGTVTPSLSEPRGVPVDSSVPTGGCGSKRPRLLETLPEVECVVRARIPTTTGAEMFLHLYTNNVDNKEHLAIVFGPNIRSKSLDAPREGETEMDRLIRGAYTGRLYPGRLESRVDSEPGKFNADANSQSQQQRQQQEEEKQRQQQMQQQQPSATPPPPLVRIHSECYTGETVWSARCDCGEQLDEAARLMSLPSNTSGGIIIYLRQEGRGIGLGEKLKAYNLQDLGSDTVEANLLLRHPADARSYGLATAMLLDLGQKDIRLLTNNPDKIRAVEGPNREIVVKERVAMVPLSWKGRGGFRAPEVEGYLRTKIEKMGHLLDMGSLPS
ncbi:GTP cyclohydrolase II domain containing protein [Naviculisporaceae sp. PSN 640]